MIGIKGYGMPRYCVDCPACGLFPNAYRVYYCKYLYCFINTDERYNKRLDKCPLIEIKEESEEKPLAEQMYDLSLSLSLENSEEEKIYQDIICMIKIFAHHGNGDGRFYVEEEYVNNIVERLEKDGFYVELVSETHNWKDGKRMIHVVWRM